MDEYLKQYCWFIRLNYKFKDKISPFTMPRLSQSISFIPLSLRYFFSTHPHLILNILKLNLLLLQILQVSSRMQRAGHTAPHGLPKPGQMQTNLRRAHRRHWHRLNRAHFFGQLLALSTRARHLRA